MAIQLTQADIDKINERLNSGQNNEPNYAGMYQYIFDTYGSQMEGKQKYWFQQAAQINAYLNYVAEPSKYQYTEPTQSAYFIQQINKESLRLAGKSNSDEKIQEITNAIAFNVYKDIVEGSHIPGMISQVDQDINVAINKGGLNVSQWGGAFYFWDMELPTTNNVKIGKPVGWVELAKPNKFKA